MKDKIRSWLQLFRAQTAPATILLVLVSYLAGGSFRIEALPIGLLALFAHWLSFGHNSLMDTAMGYDLKDPSKKHHPLVSGRLSLHSAHNVIHWGLSILILIASIMTLLWSPNPALALFSLMLWVAFGHAYNDGLSKESLFSFVPISICMVGAGLWGWFLSHSTLDLMGWLLIGYYFFTILFQISWSGHLKDIQQKERSNILVKMGAEVRDDVFYPGASRIYAWVIKAINLYFGYLLLMLNKDLVRLVWVVLLTFLAVVLLDKLTKTRFYDRDKDLFNMSAMEVVTIYLPIPLVLPWLESVVLMLFGIIYFVMFNFWLWSKPYPKV